MKKNKQTANKLLNLAPFVLALQCFENFFPSRSFNL